MIDHLLGRPSSTWKRAQVIIVALSWFFYLYKSDRRGPRFFHNWNKKLSRYSPFQLIAGTLALLYILKNADRLVGLGSPEPLARLYSRNYYRATWILTALDAGFWTSMSIRPTFLRDIMAIVFSVYYMIFADQADEKTRRIRATITVEHLRMSWEKMLNPYLHAAIRLFHPHLRIHQKKIRIQRPKSNPYNKKPITAYIYFKGDEETLYNFDRLILNFPGGGFIGMSPPCHEDYLSYIAKCTGVPLVSIDYGKAPEYPYPYALEECFDAYRSIMESNGEVIGMAGWTNKDGIQRPRIRTTLFGDSAGGNLVASVMLKILRYPSPIPHPSGIVLIYPCLNFDINCWMPASQLSVIRAESTESIPGVLESKDHLHHKSPLAVVPDVKPRRRWRKSFSGSIEDDRTIEERVQIIEGHEVKPGEKKKRSHIIGTRLAMTSRMSFFNDRILTPDLMRAMAILYLGPNNYPDFLSDYFLSPIVAPDELLAQFPKTYLMCGEKDPFVDDTVVFAGRIREAKRKKRQLGVSGKFGENFRMSDLTVGNSQEDDDVVEVKVLQGVSHAFLQMLTLLPETKGALRALSRWMIGSFQKKTLDKNRVLNCDGGKGAIKLEKDVQQDKDELLYFTSRHPSIDKTESFQQANQPNQLGNGGHLIDIPGSFDNHNNRTSSSNFTEISDLHNAVTSPDVTSHEENGDALHTLPSEGTITPHNERERMLWEQKHILSETEIMKRRRENLIRGLREGCEEQFPSSQSSSDSMVPQLSKLDESNGK
ncbi:hypothetical protein G9A89_021956 [Geosiphon pyriformis]|nr:hypothetical protein G9A89_021956 [Geosiphon pyriformis]